MEIEQTTTIRTKNRSRNSITTLLINFLPTGQAIVPQSSNSLSPPSQDMPLADGAGFVQSRDLNLEPPPHVALHIPHDVHVLHIPSIQIKRNTFKKNGRYDRTTSLKAFEMYTKIKFII